MGGNKNSSRKETDHNDEYGSFGFRDVSDDEE